MNEAECDLLVAAFRVGIRRAMGGGDELIRSAGVMRTGSVLALTYEVSEAIHLGWQVALNLIERRKPTEEVEP